MWLLGLVPHSISLRVFFSPTNHVCFALRYGLNETHSDYSQIHTRLSDEFDVDLCTLAFSNLFFLPAFPLIFDCSSCVAFSPYKRFIFPLICEEWHRVLLVSEFSYLTGSGHLSRNTSLETLESTMCCALHEHFHYSPLLSCPPKGYL